MAASRQEVDEWIKFAKTEKNEYIISVCDTWYYDDFAVFL